MANRIFYQQDCNLAKLDGKTVAIIGYGSQGHAHALNLHESGVNVIVGLYEGSKSWAKAEAAGLKKGDIVVKMDGQKVSGGNDLLEKLQYYEAGEVVEIVVARANNGEYEEITVEVKMGAKSGKE